ncbi:MAG: PD-(D/E)XK nuclease family protein [Bryobacteraceae bacterium]|nr:PD-(D/E)XK nuclease family protein [Bryobacteraceae bacterium]
MLLLSGPPASGKTSYCLDRIRQSIRSGTTDCRLLTPTTTMAEHLRNELAREGLVFSPKIISTFGKFIAEYIQDLTPVSRPALELLVREELGRLSLPRYESVRDFPGFRAALVRAAEEYAGAGGGSAHLHATDPEFAAVFEAVEARLAKRGQYFRADRLRKAAERIRTGPKLGTVCVTGFFGFTPAEVEVLRALAESCDLIVALADTPSARPALKALRAFGAREEQLPEPLNTVPRTLFTAPSVEGEATEIARRIVAEHKAGLAFRDIGIIVRSEQPFVPALRTALERFGIPFRSYFAAPLHSDATVRFLSGLVDAALSGWDHERSLPVLRMHGSPLETGGDEFEYKVLGRIPAVGLNGLREAAPEATQWWFEKLAAITSWAVDSVLPAVWARRFSGLTALFARPEVRDGVSQEQMLAWRRQSAALEHFSAAVFETAEVLGESGPIPCQVFREALDAALGSAELRIVDRRRDVVHIVDAVEARQWRLKAMFLCGLLEDLFPKHHTEDPILPDSVRRELQKLGVAMRTSAERQEEERVLFDLALTRATTRVCLSYPMLNAKGEPNLPSLLLEGAKPYTVESTVLVKPGASRRRAPEPFSIIQSEPLRQRLAGLHATMSPTRIDKFLTCPWSFFAQRTLRLAEAPERPWDRLNNLVQGTVAHAVLELVCRDGVAVNEAFDRIFEQTCDTAEVPDGYRTEAIRLELLHGIRLLVADARLKYRGVASRFEEPFSCELPGGLKIRGQIDRIEVDHRGNAIVFDYKYKRRHRIDNTVRENRQGRRVQTGLYLTGARHLGLRPAGMVYIGFKREASFGGWVLSGLWPELQAACSQSELDEVVETAREKSLQAWSDILSGRIAPAPFEPRDCEYCSYTTVCRIEAVPEPAVEVVNAAQ